jgi:hypothetical protein
MAHMFDAPVALALLVEEGAPPWLLRRWAAALGLLSPRAVLAGGAIYLDLSWQRGREREAATFALSLAPGGLRARAGVGRGMAAAALAASLALPSGAFLLPEEEGERMRLLAPLPVSLLPLSGWAQRRLGLLGLTTLGRLQLLAREALWELLGREGELSWWWARGIDPRPFPWTPQGPVEVGVERELPWPELSPEGLAALVRRLAREAMAAAGGRACREAELWGEMAWGQAYRLPCRLPVPIASAEELARALTGRLLASPPPGPLLRARLLLRGLVGEWGRQEGLLPAARDRGGLLEAARELEGRYGRPLIYRPVEVRPWEALPERGWMLMPIAGWGERA